MSSNPNLQTQQLNLTILLAFPIWSSLKKFLSSNGKAPKKKNKVKQNKFKWLKIKNNYFPKLNDNFGRAFFLFKILSCSCFTRFRSSSSILCFSSRIFRCSSTNFNCSSAWKRILKKKKNYKIKKGVGQEIINITQ